VRLGIVVRPVHRGARLDRDDLGPKAKLSIVTALAETGFTAAEGAADAGIPLMLGCAAGKAVDSGDGIPVFPEKPAGFAPLTGLIVALAEVPAVPPHAASNMAPAAAVTASRQRQRREGN
jgi:hypothetical protein